MISMFAFEFVAVEFLGKLLKLGLGLIDSVVDDFTFPGTENMILQGLLPGIATVSLLIKIYWPKMLRLF